MISPKISIILPVYNTGEILRDTINSILAQTYKDFELILVDDGSKDVSKDICDEFANQDERIITIHKANGGICDARNAGIKIAKGKYITFCDHDDEYSPTLLEKEFFFAERTNADVICVGFKAINATSGKTTYILSPKNNLLADKNAIAEDYVNFVYCNTMFTIWNKLYKADIIKMSNGFDIIYKRGHEDVNFNLKLLPLINSIFFLNDVLYKHIVRLELSTSSKIYKETLIGIRDLYNNYNKIALELKIPLDNFLVAKYNQLNKEQLFWSLVMYAIKTNISFGDFKFYINSLDYKSCDSTWYVNKFFYKSVIYKLYLHRQYKLIYFIMNIFFLLEKLFFYKY